MGCPSSTYVGDSWPVYMDPQGALYMRDGDIWYQLRSTGHGELFYPIDKAPSSIKPLNLEILSMDNSGKIKELIGKTQSFRPLMTSYNKQIYGYYEKRIYEIPNESQGLIISLNYPWEMRDAGGKPIPSFLINYPVVVNELVLEGNNLLFDQPPVTPEKPSVPETGSSGSSSSGGGSGSHTGGGAHGPMMRSFCPIIRQRIPGSTERKYRLNLRKSPVRRYRSAAVQREAGNKNHRPAKRVKRTRSRIRNRKQK